MGVWGSGGSSYPIGLGSKAPGLVNDDVLQTQALDGSQRQGDRGITARSGQPNLYRNKDPNLYRNKDPNLYRNKYSSLYRINDPSLYRNKDPRQVGT